MAEVFIINNYKTYRFPDAFSIVFSSIISSFVGFDELSLLLITSSYMDDFSSDGEPIGVLFVSSSLYIDGDE